MWKIRRLLTMFLALIVSGFEMGFEGVVPTQQMTQQGGPLFVKEAEVTPMRKAKDGGTTYFVSTRFRSDKEVDDTGGTAAAGKGNITFWDPDTQAVRTRRYGRTSGKTFAKEDKTIHHGLGKMGDTARHYPDDIEMGGYVTAAIAGRYPGDSPGW